MDWIALVFVLIFLFIYLAIRNASGKVSPEYVNDAYKDLGAMISYPVTLFVIGCFFELAMLLIAYITDRRQT